MAWDRIKRLLGRKQESASQIPNPNWIEAADNPWGVRVLDVRPVTLTMLSTSADPQCASNAVSFGQDDGSSFIGEAPPTSRIAEASLRFQVNRILVDGVLFVPREMEHKWALFYHREEVICVWSWLRKVQVVARVEQRHDHVEITQVRGTFDRGAAPNPDAEGHTPLSLAQGRNRKDIVAVLNKYIGAAS